MNTKAEQTEVKTSNSLRFTATKSGVMVYGEKADIIVKIRLDDECKNGHQDFSIVADIYKHGKRGDKNYIAGGCCHEEILKHFPEFEIFVKLHLCDYTGVPMYAVENGFYHLVEGFNNVKPNESNFKAEFCNYYRIKPAQFDILIQSENKIRYALNLQNLGILEQWREEANKAILILEELTGVKFLVDSKRTQYTAPTAEQIAEEDKKDKEGYYKPENVQKRKAQEVADKKVAKYKAIEDDKNKEIAKALKEYEVNKSVLDAGLSLENFIFYSHSNTGCFNWKNYGERITKTEFEQFLKVVSIDGVKFECK